MIHKILIADDEPALLKMYADLIRQHHFYVCTARNLEEFICVFSRENPDLLIMDIDFGSATGPEVYDQVMRFSSAPKTPVIFMSGMLEKRAESPLVRGRQVAMYAKPLDIDKIVQDIQSSFLSPHEINGVRVI